MGSLSIKFVFPTTHFDEPNSCSLGATKLETVSNTMLESFLKFDS
jgi:hypothetical protein